jgi:AcrR family transcriptional regulator
MGAGQSGYARKRTRSAQALDADDARTRETREAIIAAARHVLLAKGYANARIEDIILRAGISRPTFYRHFRDKFEVAKAWHALSRDRALGPWGKLASIDFRDSEAVRAWLDALLDAHGAMRDELIVWAGMSAAEPDYLMRVPRQMPALIERLGEAIPAFARAREQAPADADEAAGPLWVEAYLLLEHLSYTCTWLTMGSHPISRTQSLDYFAERLERFIARHDDQARDMAAGPR